MLLTNTFFRIIPASYAPQGPVPFTTYVCTNPAFLRDLSFLIETAAAC
jgi:hypothetical protein